LATTTTPPRGGKHRPGGGTSPAAQTPQTKTKTKPKKKRGFFRRFWWVFFVVPLVGILALFGTLWFVYSHLTLPNPPAGPQTSVIYDRHGAVIARLHATVNRTEIPLDAMPASLKNAVIASEDKNFYHEGGISPIGIARAAFRDLISHHVVQGGSTITQQYVKLTYTGSERTIARKVKEALLAMKLDHALTKNKILEKYLNIVYFGNGAYGVQAAAQTYWHIPARKLTVPESATLSGLIPAPSTFEPVNHPEVARERRNTVLTLMAQQGYISAADAARYKAEPLKVSKSTSTAPAKDGYFVDYVTRQLLDKYRYDETFSGGLRVHTTLDATDAGGGGEGGGGSPQQPEGSVRGAGGDRPDPRARSERWWGAGTSTRPSSTWRCRRTARPVPRSSRSRSPRPWRSASTRTRCGTDRPRS